MLQRSKRQTTSSVFSLSYLCLMLFGEASFNDVQFVLRFSLVHRSILEGILESSLYMCTVDALICIAAALAETISKTTTEKCRSTVGYMEIDAFRFSITKPYTVTLAHTFISTHLRATQNSIPKCHAFHVISNAIEQQPS